jgi:hypothetical protein
VECLPDDLCGQCVHAGTWRERARGSGPIALNVGVVRDVIKYESVRGVCVAPYTSRLPSWGF